MSYQKLDDNEVEQLLRSGWTQMRVVRMYREKGVNVSQSAISQAIDALKWEQTGPRVPSRGGYCPNTGICTRPGCSAPKPVLTPA